MEAGSQPETPAQRRHDAADVSALFPRATKHRPLCARDVQLYRICEDLTGGLIYFMVVFGPWALGTTQPWSIQVMNAVGYLAGTLLVCKLAIRRLKGYQPPRWDGSRKGALEGARASRLLTPARLTAALAVATMVILAYCLVSAVNARATFHPDELSFAYQGPHKWVKWLPHSLDGARTWLAFWNYLGLACSFWAMRDWLLGKTEGEERAERRRKPLDGASLTDLLPGRLRRLLWVLALNGAVLGAEGIIQRLEGSGRLLFLVKPRVNPDATTQFGPYAYRANASQYFNLLWPVCLGLWWTLNQSRGFRRKAHHLILVSCVIMAACPIISTSRAGALITISIVVLAAVFLAASHFILTARQQAGHNARWATLACLLFFLVGALGLGFGLGWKNLEPRLAHLSEGFEIRQRMCDLARPMAEDYPLFGTGPGTFETVFQLYRVTTDTYWPAQLHNDWLETRITFGWVGSALVALALVIVWLRWFVGGGFHGGGRFAVFIWLALAGCLAHAGYDFPFQIYSIVFLFLVLCAILFDLPCRP